MRRWRNGAWALCGFGLGALAGTSALASSSCDEYNPLSPSRSARIQLNGSDLVEQHGDEMRSFIATGSIGKVDAVVVSSQPKGVVRAVSAVPEISRVSPHYGEALKGIAVVLSLRGAKRPVTIVLNLKQVCAEYFRNTFLYY
ncbi:MAG TPA: hypothetical protein VHY35_22915 [Stellaceae bacterium]|nr:hypothetical protein [Stellaceae bacterium]